MHAAGGVACAQVWVLELVRIAPKGSTDVSRFLKEGADALVEARAAHAHPTPPHNPPFELCVLRDPTRSVCDPMR